MRQTICGVITVVIVGTIGVAGSAFLLTPVLAEAPSRWIWVAELDSLPLDGTPIRVPVTRVERDAWILKRDRSLGHVYLRRVRENESVVAVTSITGYGAAVEYDVETRLFHDRRCWGFRFDLDGKCVDPCPHSNLLKLDVQVRDGNVYIVHKLPRWGD
jgi:hypothetical protein